MAYLIVYTKAGFVICLVHETSGLSVFVSPRLISRWFWDPSPSESNLIGSPLFGSSPRELKPLFLVALSLSFPTWTRRTSSPPEANSGSPPVFPTQLNAPHLHSILRYVFFIYYARDGPQSSTG